MESLICSSDHRAEVKEKALLDLFMGFNKTAVAGLPFSEQDKKFKKPLICTISLESCKFHAEAMKCKFLNTVSLLNPTRLKHKHSTTMKNIYSKFNDYIKYIQG